MRRTLLVFPVLLLACGDGKREAAELLAKAAETNATVVDLSAHDMPLEVHVGDLATLGADTVSVSWNEEFGWLVVQAGERFVLTIREEPGDLDRVKADLARSTLQTHQMLRDSADRLVYRSRFPDEDLVFHHFHRVLVVGARSFVVQDGPQGRFTEAEVLRMEAAVRPKQAS